MGPVSGGGEGTGRGGGKEGLVGWRGGGGGPGRAWGGVEAEGAGGLGLCGRLARVGEGRKGEGSHKPS